MNHKLLVRGNKAFAPLVEGGDCLQWRSGGSVSPTASFPRRSLTGCRGNRGDGSEMGFRCRDLFGIGWKRRELCFCSNKSLGSRVFYLFIICSSFWSCFSIVLSNFGFYRLFSTRELVVGCWTLTFSIPHDPSRWPPLCRIPKFFTS